jgi:hypothetical protein
MPRDLQKNNITLLIVREMEFCKVFFLITFLCNSIQNKSYPKAGAREEEAGGGEEEAAGGQEKEGAGGQRKGRELRNSPSSRSLIFNIHAT